MKKFKANSQIHEIEEGFEHLLPIGAIEITSAEADNLLLPSLQEYKKTKVLDLYKACDSHILGGFISNALGVDHTYPSTTTDQTNLNGVVTESLVNEADVNWTAPFWCADATNVWDRRVHTHVQIQQVGQAAAVHVRDAQDKLKLLVDQVNDPLTDSAEKVDLISF